MIPEGGTHDLAGRPHREGERGRLGRDGGGYQVLWDFSPSGAAFPFGRVVELSDGFLYGTTRQVGSIVSSASGAIFRIAKTGSSFSTVAGIPGGAAGRFPEVGVTEGADGVNAADAALA